VKEFLGPALALSVAGRIAMTAAMFESKITEACGPKGKHNAERAAVRHGTEKGSVTLGGRRVAATRPRARTTTGHEVPLASYAHFASEDLLAQVRQRGLAAYEHRDDLTFSLAERWSEAGGAAGIGGTVEFRTDVFDARSIAALVERLRRLLVAMTADSGNGS
jgi:hypothetical protein